MSSTTRSPDRSSPSTTDAASATAALADASSTVDAALSASGALYLRVGPPLTGTQAATAPVHADVLARIRAAFDRDYAYGVFHLGAVEVDADLPPGMRYYREFARKYLAGLCADPTLEDRRENADAPRLDPDALAAFALAAPPVPGAEYIDPIHLTMLWYRMHFLVCADIAASTASVQDYLRAKNPIWNLVGRLCLHLAENRIDPDHPFGFLATLAARVSGRARLKHRPLSKALEAAHGDRDALLSVLVPIKRAAEKSELIAELVDSGDLFRPMAWTAARAHAFLQQVPVLEASGVVVRVPDWWKARHRVGVSVRVGNDQPGDLGVHSMLDFSIEVTLDGEPLSPAELEALLRSTDGLAAIRGRWVELDNQRLQAVLDHWRGVEAAAEDGLSFHEAMRLLAARTTRLDAGCDGDAALADVQRWSDVEPGDWLASLLAMLRKPSARRDARPGRGFEATLRPYQEIGVSWLHFASSLGLGVCLADDMGLGKTIQILGLLVLLRRRRHRPTHLLVVPASLIANWQAEAARFAPGLRILIAHPSAMPTRDIAALPAAEVERHDVVITSYGTVHRVPWMDEIAWDLVILDEAQAIKNPGAKQTRAVKRLPSRCRVALTGTPVENHLGDLWSLFDFLAPGLLGPAARFRKYARDLVTRGDYTPLRRLVSPYILRRQKTDPGIADDLPDKTELLAFCGLSRPQAALYQKSVDELARRLADPNSAMERRGLVLSFLLRFKQICNHPSQWLGDGVYQPEHSGKFARLRELAEGIADRQEKVLVFTQFRELVDPLHDYLQDVFGGPGVTLHGQTPVARRKQRVDRFQDEPRVGYFVISLKAGGTGLNLTAASHVIHFDRWWNPAVENQATDRAYRIGQRKNVLVHKFVCRGTIEERIDALISGKQALSRELLDASPGALLTELDDQALLDVVTLDIDRAMDRS